MTSFKKILSATALTAMLATSVGFAQAEVRFVNGTGKALKVDVLHAG